MTSESTNTLILEKLEVLTHCQSDIEKNIATILERIDQRDKQYCDQFSDIRDDIKKGYEGRTVLHKKQDDLEKDLNTMRPTIDRVESTFKNIGKIIWGFVAVILAGVLISSLPAIIEVLK